MTARLPRQSVSSGPSNQPSQRSRRVAGVALGVSLATGAHPLRAGVVSQVRRYHVVVHRVKQVTLVTAGDGGLRVKVTGQRRLAGLGPRGPLVRPYIRREPAVEGRRSDALEPL